MSLKLGFQDTFLFSPQWITNSNLEIFDSIFQVYSNIEWIYINFQIWIPYIINIWYLTNINSIFDESLNLFFYFFWFLSLRTSNSQLFAGFIMDFFSKFLNFQNLYFSTWFNWIGFNYSGLSLLFYHPEILWLQFNIISTFYLSSLSELYYTIFITTFYETFQNIFYTGLYFLIIFYLLLLFINLYFSFFLTISKSQATWDLDFFFMSISLESEKEISAFDDVLLIFIIIIYFFGWYFCLNFWSMCSILPELIFMFYSFPLLYFIIVGIPSFLILDFGIYFLAYLKGVASSPLLLFELIFDYIAVVIFYTRILVQGIRLILMLAVYISMQDVILNFTFYRAIFLNFETLSHYQLNRTFSIFSFFFLFTLPSLLINCIYEVLHTYFVVTIQFIAFFAIVFWLFLFLYTFFVFEKQENYFSIKRHYLRSKLM